VGCHGHGVVRRVAPGEFDGRRRYLQRIFSQKSPVNTGITGFWNTGSGGLLNEFVSSSKIYPNFNF
jgi:hypothetical protein